MKIYPCAKINLGLNIVGKREDGYHNLETVFYPVKIFDTIEINEADEFKFEMAGNPVEGDPEKNLVVRAYKTVAEQHPLPPVHIILDKQIPMQAGMGGGSADCAFTILLLNNLFHLGMSVSEMQLYASKLGADCAFFIEALPAYAEGIGEKLHPIELDLSKYVMIVVKTSVAISTREAFAGINVRKPAKNCRDIVRQPIETWREELVNDFEESLFPQHPELAAIKERLYELGALYAAMSGSGSALFGFFQKEPDLAQEFTDCEKWIL